MPRITAAFARLDSLPERVAGSHPDFLEHICDGAVTRERRLREIQGNDGSERQPVLAYKVREHETQQDRDGGDGDDDTFDGHGAFMHRVHARENQGCYVSGMKFRERRGFLFRL